MSAYDAYAPSRKPDPNCRTCNDFKFWSKQQRQIFENAGDQNSLSKVNNAVDVGGDKEWKQDCPLDKSKLGQSTWGLMHTMAAFYSDNPTDSQKRDMKSFFEVIARLYPCEYCAKDFQKDLKQNPINVESQKEFSQWLCEFHNRVNLKLGKPIFDCFKVNERWRDGWLDGSCG